MGLYDILRAEATCPRCGAVGPVDVEFRFGSPDLTTYALGDAFPSPADHAGEGYAECPACGKDYWLVVTVRAGVLTAAAADPSRPGHIP